MFMTFIFDVLFGIELGNLRTVDMLFYRYET